MKKNHVASLSIALLLGLVLAACSTIQFSALPIGDRSPVALYATPDVQAADHPDIVINLKARLHVQGIGSDEVILRSKLRNYHDLGEYMGDVAIVDGQAEKYIIDAASHAEDPSKLALVLDIDETTLSNWPQMNATNFGYDANKACTVHGDLPDTSCGGVAWQLCARDVAIEPTLQLYRMASQLHVSVFFITGRNQLLNPAQAKGAHCGDDGQAIDLYYGMREATVKNLQRAGFDHWAGLYLRPGTTDDTHDAASVSYYKERMRKEIAEHYTIIADVGDQLSDLTGVDTGRTFKLPNPFYYIP